MSVVGEPLDLISKISVTYAGFYYTDIGDADFRY
jgi:hypothetical protein